MTTILTGKQAHREIDSLYRTPEDRLSASLVAAAGFAAGLASATLLFVNLF